jgi:hypothetical protein
LANTDSRFVTEEFKRDAARAKAAFQASTPTPSLPTMGNGIYVGFGRIDIAEALYGPEGTQLIGQANLNAAFSSSGATLDGTVNNFFYRNDTVFAGLREALESEDPDQVGAALEGFESASGELTVTANSISSPLFEADVAGSIDTGSRSFLFGGATAGQFFGDDAEVVRLTGNTVGALTVTDGSTAQNADLIIIGTQ